MGVTVEELAVADEPGAWAALGFALDGDACALGEVRLRAVGARAGRGIVGWSLRGAASSQLDGLPTTMAAAGEGGAAPAGALGSARTATHPNGVAGLDHIVAITPRLDRSVAALQAAGLDLRRIRERPTPAGAPRQAFFRLGPTVLELVQEPAEMAERNGPDRDAFFWGLALLAPDLDATADALGPERVGEPRDAVQPGRRIATLRRAAGLSLPIALITP